MPTNEEVNLKVNIEFHPELINRAAEAIKRLAERLSTLLDDDQFNNLEPELQAISACLVSAKTNVVPASAVELNDSQLLDALDERIAALNLRWLARNDGYPAISTAPGAERHGIRDAMRALLVLMPSYLREGGFAVMPQQQIELGAPAGDGWLLVPKVPTQAMRDAGFEAIPGIMCALAVNLWDAMLAAAPHHQNSGSPAYYVRQVHNDHLPEFNTVDEFSDGQGGGEALYRKPQSGQRAGVAEDARVVVDRYMVCGVASVQRARQMRRPDMWKVEKSGENLNKSGEWEQEPMPSFRDDAFLERCRFASAEEAIRAAILAAEPEAAK